MRKPFTKSKGFTLLELIIVISLLAILLAGGVASFISYNRAQSLNTAALDVMTMLNKAKSRAQSQVKPSDCANQSLAGYKVTISVLSSRGAYPYVLYAVCVQSNVLTDFFIESKTLPENINFNGTTKTSFLFQVISGGISGGAAGEGTVVVNGYGQTKNIRVDRLGNININ